eukprot:5578330-Alexandrium_andersonii.AAC.1
MAGVIAHGWGKFGFLLDPTLPKDCNAFIEAWASPEGCDSKANTPGCSRLLRHVSLKCVWVAKAGGELPGTDAGQCWAVRTQGADA